MPTAQLHAQLKELEAERALATLEGLARNATYMAALDGEIAATRHAYVGVAVAQIATLRGELSGPQVG
jgi:hypothetical protein